MKTPETADLQRWSDEVARDPRSLAFLPLARAYRRRGLRDAALQLCLRGLSHHPAHVEAHSLLALLYLDRGDRQRAADEWSIVLRVEPDNFEALRGMGFSYLEQDQLTKARNTLERAALLRPSDPAVKEALELLGDRNEQGEAVHDPLFADDPWSAPQPAQPDAESPGQAAAPPEARSPEPAPAAVPTPVPAPPRHAAIDEHDPAVGTARAGQPAGQPGWTPFGGSFDPAALFDELLGTGPLLGVLLIDAQGLVHAGRMTEAVAGDAVVLGAVIGGAIGEAARTAAHLSLGQWRGIQLEAEHALLHLTPAGGDAVVLLAARRNAPAGWMLRSAAHAAELATRYLEAYA